MRTNVIDTQKIVISLFVMISIFLCVNSARADYGVEDAHRIIFGGVEERPDAILLAQSSQDSADVAVVTTAPVRVADRDPEVITITRAIDGTGFVVEDGNTLYGMTKKYTGEARKWPVVARRNGIVTPNSIYPGQVIVFPNEMLLPKYKPVPAAVVAELKEDLVDAKRAKVHLEGSLAEQRRETMAAKKAVEEKDQKNGALRSELTTVESARDNFKDELAETKKALNAAEIAIRVAEEGENFWFWFFVSAATLLLIFVIVAAILLWLYLKLKESLRDEKRRRADAEDKYSTLRQKAVRIAEAPLKTTVVEGSYVYIFTPTTVDLDSGDRIINIAPFTKTDGTSTFGRNNFPAADITVKNSILEALAENKKGFKHPEKRREYEAALDNGSLIII